MTRNKSPQKTIQEEVQKLINDRSDTTHYVNYNKFTYYTLRDQDNTVKNDNLVNTVANDGTSGSLVAAGATSDLDEIEIGKLQTVNQIANVFDTIDACKEVIEFLIPEVKKVLDESFLVKKNIPRELYKDGYVIDLMNILSFRTSTWLDTTIIDWYMKVILEKSNYNPSGSDPIITNCAQYLTKSFEQNEKIETHQDKIKIMFVREDTHFQLALILPSFEGKVRIILFDSEKMEDTDVYEEKDTDEISKRLETFGVTSEAKTFISNKIIKKKNWPVQKDEHSCGIFVCFYALEILTKCRKYPEISTYSNEEIERTLSLNKGTKLVVNEYRLHILKEIIEDTKKPSTISENDDGKKWKY